MRAILAFDYDALCTIFHISRTIQTLLNKLGTAQLIEEPELVRFVFWKDAHSEPGILNGVHIYHSAISVHVSYGPHILQP